MEHDDRVAELTAALEQLVRLFLRKLTPPSGHSVTAVATLATLERAGPCRLTELATHEGVTQPAMTQLVSRLGAQGLVARDIDPSDGRVVRVSITDAGRAALANRRAARGERIAELLDRMSPDDRAALTAAVPAMAALIRLAEADRVPSPRTVLNGAPS